MQLARRQFLHLAVAAVALPAVSRVAKAQVYPARPITMVVPFAAGGPLDVVGRILAERMRASLGQAIIIENIIGASGSIGVGHVARAAPDGHTISIGQLGTHVLNGAVYPLPYHVLTDFEPVSAITRYPWLIAVRNSFPADDLRGFITWLKANPGKALAGTAGVGSNIHLAGVLFQKESDTRFQSVPYRGSGPAMQDLVAGQIGILFDSVVLAVPQMRAGRIKIFAVTAKNRLGSAPEIPTVDEAGLPSFHVSSWHALLSKLNAAVVDALADPSVRARIANLGLESFPRDQQTPEALRALQKAEIEKWWPIIKAANIKAE